MVIGVCHSFVLWMLLLGELRLVCWQEPGSSHGPIFHLRVLVYFPLPLRTVSVCIRLAQNLVSVIVVNRYASSVLHVTLLVVLSVRVFILHFH